MQSDSEYNARILALLEEHFGTKIEPQGGGGVRIASKILLHYDSYFEWPSLESFYFSHAACLGLKSHFGILADGRAVPCCLDSNGVIDLGDLAKRGLKMYYNPKGLKRSKRDLHKEEP
ncbi:MAG: SPASM domain-containing protein [Epsilonproteobacteria bacterium]|nr:SPASM domain-containing protein [Campylobacterota bacterium]